MNKYQKAAIFAIATTLPLMAVLLFAVMDFNTDSTQIKIHRHANTKRKPIVKNAHKSTDSINAVLPYKEFTLMKESEKLKTISKIDSFDSSLLDLAVSDNSDDVKLTAMEKISQFAEEGEEVSDYLAIALKDKSETVRDAAFSVIDSLEDKDTVLELANNAMDTKYPESRIKAIGYFVSSNATKQDLIHMMPKALSDPNKKVRAWALATADFIWNQDFIAEDDAIRFISK